MTTPAAPVAHANPPAPALANPPAPAPAPSPANPSGTAGPVAYAAPLAPLTDLALPVIVAAASTFLRMLIDDGKLSGWELAVAKGLLSLVGNFQSSGGPVAQLKQAHVSGSLPVSSGHQGLLRDFPREDITPETLKAWGEAMEKNKDRPLSENPILNWKKAPHASVTAKDIAELIGPSDSNEPSRPMEPPKPPPSPAKPPYPAVLAETLPDQTKTDAEKGVQAKPPTTPTPHV